MHPCNESDMNSERWRDWLIQFSLLKNISFASRTCIIDNYNTAVFKEICRHKRIISAQEFGFPKIYQILIHLYMIV